MRDFENYVCEGQMELEDYLNTLEQDEKKQMGEKRRQLRCEWFRGKDHFETSCGYKAKWERKYNFCPFCGRRMIVINRLAEE